MKAYRIPPFSTTYTASSFFDVNRRAARGIVAAIFMGFQRLLMASFDGSPRIFVVDGAFRGWSTRKLRAEGLNGLRGCCNLFLSTVFQYPSFVNDSRRRLLMTEAAEGVANC